jgi:hypothetical protein
LFKNTINPDFIIFNFEPIKKICTISNKQMT